MFSKKITNLVPVCILNRSSGDFRYTISSFARASCIEVLDALYNPIYYNMLHSQMPPFSDFEFFYISIAYHRACARFQ